MEQKQYQKWVNLSYLAIAALVAFILFRAGQWSVARFDLETRVRNVDVILQGVSVGVGVLLFAFLFRHKKTNTFMNEVALELSKVTWPTQKDTWGSTWIVIIMVLISGLFLGVVDYFWTEVVKWIL